MNPLVRWFHQLGSPPYFDRFAARWTPWCYLAALVLFGVGLWQALFVVPADYQQGDSFRILYIHVPSAWMSMFVFGAGSVAVAAQGLDAAGPLLLLGAGLVLALVLAPLAAAAAIRIALT